MRSRTTKQFRELLDTLPQGIQAKAKTAYRLWSDNPRHPSLRFEKVHSMLPIYSVRIDLNYRAIGVLNKDSVVWFWIGAHAEYEQIVAKLSR